MTGLVFKLKAKKYYNDAKLGPVKLGDIFQVPTKRAITLINSNVVEVISVEIEGNDMALTDLSKQKIQQARREAEESVDVKPEPRPEMSPEPRPERKPEPMREQETEPEPEQDSGNETQDAIGPLNSTRNRTRR